MYIGAAAMATYLEDGNNGILILNGDHNHYYIHDTHAVYIVWWQVVNWQQQELEEPKELN